jgi:hypothetical protein
MGVSLGEVLQTGGVLVAAAGLFLNWWQLRKNGLQRRAEHVVGLFAKYQDDADTLEMFRRVDLDETVSKEKTFHGSPDETKLDKLLFLFERIATLHEMGVVSASDLAFMSYEFIRIRDNQSIQAYFKWLDGWYERRGIPETCFAALRRVADKIERSRQNKNAEPAAAPDRPRE